MIFKALMSYPKTIILAAFVTLLLFGKMLFYTNHDSTIQNIDSYTQAQEFLNNLDKNALVLFDVDDTLISAPDILARGMQHMPWWFLARMFITFPQLLYGNNFEQMYSLMWQQAPRMLIEPPITSIIDRLKKRGVTVLALTSMESGPYGVIPSMPEWRYEMLTKMGVTFSQTYPDLQFTELPAHRGHHPLLYKGILCCNQRPKGEVLNAFLTRYQVKPSRLVSFDDDKSALKGIGKTCAMLHIPCTLFHYSGAGKLPGSLNTNQALQQIRTLIQEHRWISVEFEESN